MSEKLTRLSNVLKFQSTAGHFDEFHSYIMSIIKKIPGVSISVHTNGSIYVVKGRSSTYPIFTCHTDGYGPILKDYNVTRLNKNVWVAYTKKDNDMEQVQINGAAKCGVFMALRLLESLDEVGCAFFTNLGNEAEGSSNVDLDFFKSGRWAMGLDGKNDHTVYTDSGNVAFASQPFLELIRNRAEKRQFRLTSGGFSDISNMKEDNEVNLCMLVISGGYFQSASNSEHIFESAIFDSLFLAQELAENLTGVFQHTTSSVKIVPRNLEDELVFKHRSQFSDQWCNMARCSKKLMPSEKFFCYTCMIKLRAKGMHCGNCKRLLIQSTEFYYSKCVTCCAKTTHGGVL